MGDESKKRDVRSMIALEAIEALQTAGNALLTTLLPGVQSPNLDNDGQSDATTHTTKETAEEISGGDAFTAGATIEIVGLDTAVWVGADAAAAQGNAVGSPAGVPFRFTLDAGAVTFHVDAATGGSHQSHQVS